MVIDNEDGFDFEDLDTDWPAIDVAEIKTDEQMKSEWIQGGGSSVSNLKEVLATLKAMVDECWKLKGEKAQAEEEVNRIQAILTKKEGVMKEIMQDAGVELIDGTFCKYKLTEEISVEGPKDDDAWLAFKGYMKKTYPAAYESFFKMNMNTLKSWVKKELEAKPGITIPGIPPTSKFWKLSPTKKRESKKKSN